MGKYNWDKLKGNLQKGVGEKTSNDFDDPREWKLQKDDQGNGTAVIRLLPGRGGDTPPVVRIFEHSVRVWNKASNKYRYYIEPSPASIGLDCPVSSIYYELGDLGTKEGKEAQGDVSRSVKFISNILVVNDPANEENNGKIFYWKYGVKLFEKFQQALEPTEAQLKVGKKPIELFDPESGADIMLEVTKNGNFPDYSGTSIEAPSAAFETEAEMDEAVLEKCYDMTEFISEDYYKPWAELKKKIAWTLEKSPIESLLIENGSQIITEYFKQGGNRGGTQEQAPAQEDSATPSMGSGGYKPKAKKEPVPEIDISEDEIPFDATDSSAPETPEPKAEPKAEKPAPKATPKKEAKKPESDDEILAMLDEL